MKVLIAILCLATFRAVLAAVRQRRWWRKVEAEVQHRSKSAVSSLPDWSLKTALIAPIKGIDEGFSAAVSRLLRQDFSSDYDLIFVAESEDDPAVAVVQALLEDSAATRKVRDARILFAGKCSDRGQKVHNQSFALTQIRDDIEIFAFIDSDGLPTAHFLAHLISPLQNTAIGASTGFRWYLPRDSGLASAWVSVWNAMALPMIGQYHAFVWGGAMALRRQDFIKAEVEKAWQGSVSDDLGVTLSIKKMGRQLAFVPSCVVPQAAAFTLRSAWEFIMRQTTITRVYAPKVHFAALTMNLFQIIGFLAGLWLWATPFLAVLLLFYGALEFYTWDRYRFARRLWPETRSEFNRGQYFLFIFYPMVWLLNILTLTLCITARRIVWRGIAYELKPELRIKHPS